MRSRLFAQLSLLVALTLGGACASAPARPGALPPVAGAVATTCASIRAETLRLLAAAEGEGGGLADRAALAAVLDPLGRCVSGGRTDRGAAAETRGAWALALAGPPELEPVELLGPSDDGDEEQDEDLDEDVTAGDDEAAEGLRVQATATPLFVTPDGARHALARGSLGPSLDRVVDASGADAWPVWEFSPLEVEADASADWSGDGLPELVVSVPGEVELYQWDGALVRRYPQSLVLPQITRLEDLDADGRLDLRDDGFFSYDLDVDGQSFEALSLVAHALPDGGFATDDGLTRAWYAERCAGLGRSPWLLGRDGEAILRNLACARLASVSPDAVAAAIAREAPQFAASANADELRFDVTELAAWFARPLPISIGRADGLVVREPASVSASSSQRPWRHYVFDPRAASDGDLGSAWQPDKHTRRPWIMLHFAAPVTVSAIEIADGFQRQDALGDLFVMNQRATRVQITLGGVSVERPLDPNIRGYQKLRLPSPTTGDALRIRITEVAEGTRWRQVALSEVRALGPRGDPAR